MTLWTNEILPRHGHLVQSLSVEVELDTLKEPLHLSCQKNWYDNTHSGGDHRSLSPQSIFTLLEQCPGLHDFKLQFPAFSEADYAEFYHYLEPFNSRIVHLLSGMNQLQHLFLQNDSSLEEDIIVQFIKDLPSLESISLCEFSWTSQELGALTLGRHMSQLNNLTRMHLLEITSVDARWCQFPWTGLLTDVSILRCAGITPIEFHKLIHHIAPNVTILKYDLDGFEHKEHEVKPQWHTTHRFHLPALADLSLATDKDYSTMLSGFASCGDLQRLSYDCSKSPSNWDLLHSLILSRTWPKLGSFKVCT